jgi:hypothetical protein
MRKPIFAIFSFSVALGALHCGGDDSSTGGSGGSAGSSATTGNTTTGNATTSTSSGTAGSAGSTGAGSGGAAGSTGTGGAGGGLLGTCPPNKPDNGSPCPDNQAHACQFGSTFCACGAGRPWTCLDLDGGFSFDGFGFGGG